MKKSWCIRCTLPFLLIATLIGCGGGGGGGESAQVSSTAERSATPTTNETQGPAQPVLASWSFRLQLEPGQEVMPPIGGMADNFVAMPAADANAASDDGSVFLLTLEDRIAGVGRTGYRVFAARSGAQAQLLYDATARGASVNCHVGARYTLDGSGSEMVTAENTGSTCASLRGRMLAIDVGTRTTSVVSTFDRPVVPSSLTVTPDHREAAILVDSGSGLQQALFVSRPATGAVGTPRLVNLNVSPLSILGSHVRLHLGRQNANVAARYWAAPPITGLPRLYQVVPSTGATAEVSTPGSTSAPLQSVHGTMQDGSTFGTNGELMNLWSQPPVAQGPTMRKILCSSLSAQQYQLAAEGTVGDSEADAVTKRNFACNSTENPATDFPVKHVRPSGHVLVQQNGHFLLVRLQGSSAVEVLLLPPADVPRSNGLPVQPFGVSADGRTVVLTTNPWTNSPRLREFFVFDTRQWKRVL